MHLESSQCKSNGWVGFARPSQGCYPRYKKALRPLARGRRLTDLREIRGKAPTLEPADGEHSTLCSLFAGHLDFQCSFGHPSEPFALVRAVPRPRPLSCPDAVSSEDSRKADRVPSPSSGTPVSIVLSGVWPSRPKPYGAVLPAPSCPRNRAPTWHAASERSDEGVRTSAARDPHAVGPGRAESRRRPAGSRPGSQQGRFQGSLPAYPGNTAPIC
ncbi:uncharacterized protein LOC132200399 isoform X1 [Neocloeon triangulifer]|uniref:uncharacterized protein LOC132200399 isoform X1 n=1 Tax=Neocloeon triangulifer TaxID=2078957 RepID=UPI00286F899F|nr:uncharacterized protein LOC132200399 isoform X1 [Neocloeon triangulifer]